MESRSFATRKGKTKNTAPKSSPKMFFGWVKFCTKRLPSLVEKFPFINLMPTYATRNESPKTATETTVCFRRPNFAKSNVAASEIESAEDSLFKVDISKIVPRIINWPVEFSFKYLIRNKKKSMRKK